MSLHDRPFEDYETIPNRMDRPRVQFFRRMSVRLAIGLSCFVGLALTATIIAVNKGAKKELEAQALRLNAEIGRKIVLNFGERLSATRAVAMSIAEVSKSLPPVPELYQTVIPEALNLPGYEDLIAGGGYWPEPRKFDPTLARRSFFWGRDGDGKLLYYDDYNDPMGPGYHNEEWYVPAKYVLPGDVYWSRSYMDPYSFESMVTCTAPVWVGVELKGVTTVDLRLTGLSDFMSEQAKAIGGYAFALDQHNRLISFPRPDIGKRVTLDSNSKRIEEYLLVHELAAKYTGFSAIADAIATFDKVRASGVRESSGDAYPQLAARIDAESYQINETEAQTIASNILFEGEEQIDPVQFPITKDSILGQTAIGSLFSVPGTDWKVVVVTPEQHSRLAFVEISQRIAMWMAILTAIVCLLAYYFFHLELFRPVGLLTKELQRLASGDKDTARIRFNRNNELGLLAHWFNVRTARLASTLDQLQQKNIALKRASETAEEASRSKNVFLASMSHEIRTPMNAIIGMSSILSETRLSSEQSDYVRTIDTSAQSLLSLINDIMDFSKIEAGRLDLESIDFDARDVLEQVSDLVAFQAEERGNDLVCQFNPRSSAYVNGDPGRLRQILLNLATNAIKFTSGGSVNIHGDLKREEAEFIRLEFEIRDTGIGIAPETHERLFQPFSQGEDSTTRKFGGTGLGLAICKRLCSMMDGEISVESVPGLGSTFRFYVKMKVPENERPFPELPNMRHALILDASEIHRSALQTILESWSFRVYQAHDLEEANSIIQKNAKIDLVFVASLSGELLSAVRSLHAVASSRTLDIVTYTSHQFAPSAATMSAERIVDSLKKPLKYSQAHRILLRMSKRAQNNDPPVSSERKPSETGKALQPIRILVAEDNLVNQKVAERLLKRLEVGCEIVSDGAQALHAVQKSDFDLVFMDWQMPVMDGLEATRQIRRLGGKYRTLPIISVTANAMEGDADACLEAGMDDYLSKPITPEKLRGMLEKWLPGLSRQSPHD